MISAYYAQRSMAIFTSSCTVIVSNSPLGGVTSRYLGDCLFPWKMFSINEIPSKHSMSYLRFRSSTRLCYRVNHTHLFAGISILSCGASSLPLTIGRVLFDVYRLSALILYHSKGSIRLHRAQSLTAISTGSLESVLDWPTKFET